MEELIGKTISSVTHSDDELTIEFDDGTKLVITEEQQYEDPAQANLVLSEGCKILAEMSLYSNSPFI